MTDSKVDSWVTKQAQRFMVKWISLTDKAQLTVVGGGVVVGFILGAITL